MNRRQTLGAAVTFSALAACGGTGKATITIGPAIWNDGTCEDHVQPEGDYYFLPADQVAATRAKVASTGAATVGIEVGGAHIRMDITLPPTGMIIPDNETDITLDTDTNITRDQAVHAKNIHTRVELVLTKRVATPGAVSIYIRKQECDDDFANVEFHDIGQFDIHLGEFAPNTFWGLAGGHLVKFTFLGA